MGKKNNSKKINPLVIAGAIAGAAAVAAAAKKANDNKKKKSFITYSKNFDENNERQVYFIGGGLASLAGAVYLIRDCNFKGENIHIIDDLNLLDESNERLGNSEIGFICRDRRILNKETSKNFWDLMESIPSLDMPGMSVKEEILTFDNLHPTHSKARLIDKDGNKVDVTTMGFNNFDRIALGKLMITPEEKLDNLTIQDWFRHTPHFFETNFWYMWQTTFAFQKWSSLFEFKRCMERMIFEFSRIETLEGITRTPYNQYESIILPLREFLVNKNVDFDINAIVTDIEFKAYEGITVTAIHIEDEAGENIIELAEDDICIMTNGFITDNITLGDFKTAPEYNSKTPMFAELWTKMAKKKIGLGNPEPFFKQVEQTNLESFTVTCKGNMLLKLIEQYSGNMAGSGALMTFKDSSWLMSIVIDTQPHFKNQSMDTTVFFGYGLYSDKKGDYVNKPMRECTGEEILIELLHHLHFEDKIDEIMESIVNVIPCIMPYVGAQFQARKVSDRPNVVPEGSTNFAMISQFVEIPEDMAFTEEYLVKAARMAIYELLKVKNKKIIPVTSFNKDPKILLKALKKSYK